MLGQMNGFIIPWKEIWEIRDHLLKNSKETRVTWEQPDENVM